MNLLDYKNELANLNRPGDQCEFIKDLMKQYILSYNGFSVVDVKYNENGLVFKFIGCRDHVLFSGEQLSSIRLIEKDKNENLKEDVHGLKFTISILEKKISDRDIKINELLSEIERLKTKIKEAFDILKLIGGE